MWIQSQPISSSPATFIPFRTFFNKNANVFCFFFFAIYFLQRFRVFKLGVLIVSVNYVAYKFEFNCFCVEIGLFGFACETRHPVAIFTFQWCNHIFCDWCAKSFDSHIEVCKMVWWICVRDAIRYGAYTIDQIWFDQCWLRRLCHISMWK